jgi:hypothetical protein
VVADQLQSITRKMERYITVGNVIIAQKDATSVILFGINQDTE